MASNGKTRMNVTLSEDMKEWLEGESKRLGVSMSSLIVIALNTYITQQKTVQLTDYFKQMGHLPADDTL